MELQWFRLAGGRVLEFYEFCESRVLRVWASSAGCVSSESSARLRVLRVLEFFEFWGLYGVFFNSRVSEWVEVRGERNCDLAWLGCDLRT